MTHCQKIWSFVVKDINKLNTYFPIIQLNLLSDHSGNNPVRMVSDSKRTIFEDRLKGPLPSKKGAGL